MISVIVMFNMHIPIFANNSGFLAFKLAILFWTGTQPKYKNTNMTDLLPTLEATQLEAISLV